MNYLANLDAAVAVIAADKSKEIVFFSKESITLRVAVAESLATNCYQIFDGADSSLSKAIAAEVAISDLTLRLYELLNTASVEASSVTRQIQQKTNYQPWPDIALAMRNRKPKELGFYLLQMDGHDLPQLVEVVAPPGKTWHIRMQDDVLVLYRSIGEDHYWSQRLNIVGRPTANN